ncbi:L-aspartate oxidase [Gammaproteobacteria bacterium]|nr:L-aspartate oxidase [Gammaproteobacteria bacterium]
MGMSKNTDVLIVGSGIAGLSAALMLPSDVKITLITKGDSKSCSTSWAQGGIASVLSETDSFEKHLNDTISNGSGIVNKNVASTIIKEGPYCINWLKSHGVPFTEKDNKIDLTLEGAHSERRIAYIKDETGAVIHKILNDKVKLNKNINILEGSSLVDLITEKNSSNNKNNCIGAYVFCKDTKNIFTVKAKKVILATGGASKIYQFTSNPNTSTGDGIAAAWRAGCSVVNMEFIQFHPTCLYHPDIKSFLISESLRGEGGILYTPDNVRFMGNYDERKELASRDVVARAIDNEMKIHGYSNVYLDISHMSSNFIKKRFPTIYKKCMGVGIDITKEQIPVIPASHYTCGGVKTDVSGKTEINNLYVIGESAHTGFHGANRLASNSLLECLVMSKKCIEDIKSSRHASDNKLLPKWDDSLVTESEEKFAISHNWDELRKIMWNYVGIVRSDNRLKIALEKIDLIEKEVNEHYYQHRISVDLLELRNIIHVSKLIIKSAMLRKESRGLHYSIDYQKTSKTFEKNTYIKGRKNQYHLKLVRFKV